MRVVVLLSILFVIVAGGWMTEKRMASWQRPILVTVYPIVADGLPETERFVRSLDIDAFEAKLVAVDDPVAIGEVGVAGGQREPAVEGLVPVLQVVEARGPREPLALYELGRLRHRRLRRRSTGADHDSPRLHRERAGHASSAIRNCAHLASG